MERYSLTNKEYSELHKTTSEKRAIKEMLESLKAQLATSIIKEDKWWQKMAKKHNLDTVNHVHSISHSTQELVGIPRPQRQEQAKPQAVVQPPAEQGITKRERTPEMDKLVSADELKAMRIARGEKVDEN